MNDASRFEPGSGLIGFIPDRRTQLAALDELTVISTYAQLLERRLRAGVRPSDEECLRTMRAIAAASSRIAAELNPVSPVRFDGN